MVFEFIQQTLYGLLFFFGVAGIGLLILNCFKYEKRNSFLDLSIAFFVSLCLYTALAVAFLFIVPDKLLFLRLFTFGYFTASFTVIFFQYFLKRGNIIMRTVKMIKENWLVILCMVSILFLFFITIYNTSILDEWLHRSIVKFFTDNGIFPLKDPNNPQSNYIYTYHYGSQIDASAIQLIFRDGVSQSLDIFKLSYVIGTLFLFYGLILNWGGKKIYAISGTFLVFFCGASFFFLDSFTANNFINLLNIKSMWPINVPLSFSLTGITYVNIPMLIAFAYLVERLFEKKAFYSFISVLIFSILMAGFLLISEFFAAILLLCVFVLTIIGIVKKEISLIKIIVFGGIAVIILPFVIYYSGGVPRKIINMEIEKYQKMLNQDMKISANEEASPEAISPKFISFRRMAEWGYPAEEGIMTIKDNPFFYVRNLFINVVFIGILTWALIRKKIRFKDHPLLFFLVPFGFIVPLILSTSMDNLNLAKTINLGNAILYLLVFYIFLKMRSRTLFVAALFLMIVGSLSGALLGFNIQWRIFSSKGGDMYCSQNPLCYKKDVLRFFGKFEQENPGIKYVLTSGGLDSQKIIDLTNSYSVVATKIKLSYNYLMKKNIQYILTSPNSKNDYDTAVLEKEGKLRQILTDGKYAIYKVN
jgi:hypothetical protein